MVIEMDIQPVGRGFGGRFLSMDFQAIHKLMDGEMAQ